jgi:hypothetical protein
MAQRITKPGIYTDMAAADYFADPCPAPSFTQSIGKVLIDQSPLHAFTEHPRLAPPVAAEEEDPEKYVVAQAIGNAAHKLIIQRGKEIAVADFDSWRGKVPQAFKDDALAKGHVPILTKHMARAYAMERRFRAQLADHDEGGVFTEGKGEVVLAWQEGEFWFRCMVDWLRDDRLCADDLKTTGMSAAPHVLGMLAASAGWDFQAAMIERGLDVLHPESAGRRKYRFVPVENYDPFALNVMVMSEYWLTMGRKKLAAAVTLWQGAMKTGQWHGYPPIGVTPEYPGFRETQWLKREESDDFTPKARAPMLTDLSGG